MNFYNWLNENKEISMSKKIWNTLSNKAKYYINEWEAVGWHKNNLSKSFKNNDEIAKEIIQKFTPIRNYLKEKYGKTIKLYRGMIKSSNNKNSILLSWTSDKKVAEHFAGLRSPGDWKLLLKKEISDKEINDAIKKLHSKGYTFFKDYKYILDKNDPTSVHVYFKNNYLTTDYTKYLIDNFKEQQEDVQKHNKKLLDKAIIIEKNIDIDKIVWITNNLNSKEFIVLNTLKGKI